MDVMYLDGHPILDIVDEGTKFGAAQFLSNKSLKTIWDTFVKLRSTIYTGLPNRILKHQGTAFGGLFIHMAELENGKVEKAGIESDSSLGISEQYHQPLRTV